MLYTHIVRIGRLEMARVIHLGLLVLILTVQSQGIGTSSHEDTKLDPNTMPYFDNSVSTNITTVVGQHAFLLCRVHRMKDGGVSWIRKRDLHILTAGIYTYTTDQRFVVIHNEKSENWTLQIKYPQERDAGVYECQVNTEPKISMAFQLNVIESKGRILGGTDVYVKSGSSLRLTCEVEHGPHDIAQVFWYHGSSLIDPHGFTGEPLSSSDIRVATQATGDLLRSQLTIPRVKVNDSGNYTCSPTMSAPAHVIVHVISGEHPAAMQHGNRSSSTKTHLRSLEYFLLLTLLQVFLVLYSRWHRSYNSTGAITDVVILNSKRKTTHKCHDSKAINILPVSNLSTSNASDEGMHNNLRRTSRTNSERLVELSNS